MKGILSLLLVVPIFLQAQTLTISTIAGTHVAGYSGNGGPALMANMYQPNHLAIDTAGNIYVAEPGNHVVRKISPAGIITVVAGNHAPGFSGNGGPATSAKLYAPSSVCLDRAGNLYIAELGNAVVRKVNTAGIISMYAGTGFSGYAGDSGLATAALLTGPFAVICDTADNLLIADSYNNRIRKVNAATGIITTVAGSDSAGYSGDGGPATAARLSMPIDIALDKAGNLYICDIDSSVIRKVNTAGIISTVAGTGVAGYTGDGGLATAADLQFPYAICLDSSGNLYITDNANEVIREVNTAGVISTIAGTGVAGYSGDGGVPTMAQIKNPGGIKTDRHGNLFLADYGNNVVRKIGPPPPPPVNAVGALAVRSSVVYTEAPNPASNSINISCSQPITSVSIKDIAGKTITSNTCNSNSITIDIAALAPGVYFAVINGSEVKRFVKQ